MVTGQDSRSVSVGIRAPIPNFKKLLTGEMERREKMKNPSLATGFHSKKKKKDALPKGSPCLVRNWAAQEVVSSG